MAFLPPIEPFGQQHSHSIRGYSAVAYQQPFLSYSETHIASIPIFSVVGSLFPVPFALMQRKHNGCGSNDDFVFFFLGLSARKGTTGISNDGNHLPMYPVLSRICLLHTPVHHRIRANKVFHAEIPVRSIYRIRHPVLDIGPKYGSCHASCIFLHEQYEKIRSSVVLSHINPLHRIVRMEFIAGLSEWGYFGLFIAAFLAGSIIPFSSEAVLGLLLIAGYDSWGCVFSATLGNWLGGVTCYYIGYLGKTEWIHTYLKIPEEKLSKMQRFLKGKGSLFGFFVFIPVIGDIMIVALGLLRANPLGTLLSMMVGKFSRYYLVVIGINYLKEWFPNLF